MHIQWYVFAIGAYIFVRMLLIQKKTKNTGMSKDSRKKERSISPVDESLTYQDNSNVEQLLYCAKVCKLNGIISLMYYHSCMFGLSYTFLASTIITSDFFGLQDNYVS